MIKFYLYLFVILATLVLDMVVSAIFGLQRMDQTLIAVLSLAFVLLTETDEKEQKQ